MNKFPLPASFANSVISRKQINNGGRSGAIAAPIFFPVITEKRHKKAPQVKKRKERVTISTLSKRELGIRYLAGQPNRLLAINYLSDSPKDASWQGGMV
jgi:hypothetical protein